MAAVPAKSVRVAVLCLALCGAAALVAWQLARRRAAPATTTVDIAPSLDALFGGREPATPDEIDTRPSVFARGSLDEATAKLFYPSIGLGHYVYDPVLYCRCDSNLELPQDFDEHPNHGWIIKTNSLGLRDDGEPSATKPDLRILIGGASNAEGMCGNAESAAHLLEVSLRERVVGKSVETLNAGVGSSNFYNYLPVLERYRSLKPDAFVLIANGGTDLVNSLPLERYFDHRGRFPHTSRSCEPLSRSESPFVRALAGTELGQVMHLIASPTDVQTSVEVACFISDEIEKLCRADGIRFICVYLPPPLAGQPHLFSKERAEVVKLMEIEEDDLAASDRLADGWLQFLRERAIEFVDMRQAFRAAGERMYWSSDPHVNLAGQRAIADSLVRLFESR